MYILFIFRCIPGGLSVNETKHDQTVLKYLINEAKIGQNSMINSIKTNLCIKFILKSYRSFIINKLTEFSFDDNIPVDEHLNGLFNIFENILEKTCSTLINFKSIFSISSRLSDTVSDMMKSLCFDDDKLILFSNSRLNENLDKVIKNNSNNLSLNKSNILCTTRILRSQNKHKMDGDNLNLTISSSLLSKSKASNKKLTIVKKQSNINNESIASSIINNKFCNESQIDLVNNKIVDDKDNELEYNMRKLKNHDVIQINKVKYLSNFLIHNIVYLDDLITVISIH